MDILKKLIEKAIKQQTINFFRLTDGTKYFGKIVGYNANFLIIKRDRTNEEFAINMGNIDILHPVEKHRGE
jgi:hypothetical protein